MTGFTELMTVEKAYRRVSVDGCEIVGEGANGTVYRIDGDNVVKVYKDANALDEIQKERELARLALVLGIPTAISYDVVRVGDSYGSVFEMLDARSFSKILAEHPEKMEATRNNHPYKRLGTPEDYVGAAIYLASDASDFVNGEVIVVDSGKTVK